MNLSYLVNRFKELSTWQGIIVIVTGLGVKITPDKASAIAAAGAAVFGLVSALFPDKFSNTTTPTIPPAN